MRTALLLTAVMAASLSACRGETSQDPPVVLLRNMHQQQRYNSQSTSRFFSDRRTMRTPPLGTVSRFPGGANARYSDFSVSRDETFDDDAVMRGLDDHGDYVATVPAAVSGSADNARDLVRRGQQRYGIYCAPCHGEAGDGRGIVWLRGQGGRYTYPQPPTFHDDRIRHMADGQLFNTISNGVRNMPAYAAQIAPRDRWAIVSYVRALQISQATGGTP